MSEVLKVDPDFFLATYKAVVKRQWFDSHSYNLQSKRKDMSTAELLRNIRDEEDRPLWESLEYVAHTSLDLARQANRQKFWDHRRLMLCAAWLLQESQEPENV